MATVTATSRSAGIVNVASGSFTSDGTATTVTLGFVPKWVKIVNSGDSLVWEKLDGMAAADSIKILLGGSPTLTKDTSSNVLINADGTLTLSTTVVGTSGKAVAWVAYA